MNFAGDYAVMTRVRGPSLNRMAWQISSFAALERRYINETVSWVTGPLSGSLSRRSVR